jgi:hypothetical protein
MKNRTRMTVFMMKILTYLSGILEEEPEEAG